MVKRWCGKVAKRRIDGASMAGFIGGMGLQVRGRFLLAKKVWSGGFLLKMQCNLCAQGEMVGWEMVSMVAGKGEVSWELVAGKGRFSWGDTRPLPGWRWPTCCGVMKV